MESKFCIVMPIIRRSYLLRQEAKQPSSERHDNFERFFRVGWPTLMKHIEWENVATFFVIVRASERPAFERYIRKVVPPQLQSKFTLVAQEDMITVHDMEKSRVQMLSKILIATRIPTKHYLILDDDVVALRKFRFRDLFTDNTQRYVRYTHDDTFHERWFRGSAEALHLDYDTHILPRLNDLRKQKRILSVTPEIFITEQALSLLDRLKQLHGPERYQHELASLKGRWTEYTLMWIHLMQQGPVTHWYRGTRVRLSDNARNVWYASPDLCESLWKMWSDPKPYFGVIQSNVPEHEVETVITTLQKLSSA